MTSRLKQLRKGWSKSQTLICSYQGYTTTAHYYFMLIKPTVMLSELTFEVKIIKKGMVKLSIILFIVSNRQQHPN